MIFTCGERMKKVKRMRMLRGYVTSRSSKIRFDPAADANPAKTKKRKIFRNVAIRIIDIHPCKMEILDELLFIDQAREHIISASLCLK
jgi:hypothetical protein